MTGDACVNVEVPGRARPHRQAGGRAMARLGIFESRQPNETRQPLHSRGGSPSAGEELGGPLDRNVVHDRVHPLWAVGLSVMPGIIRVVTAHR
jgi:hypothetical protein